MSTPKRISDLNPISIVEDVDLVPIVDVAGRETKRVNILQMKDKINADINSQINDINNAIGTINNNIVTINNKNNEQDGRLSSIESDISGINADLSEVNQSIIDLNQEIENLETNVSANTASISSINGQLSDINDQIDAIIESLDAFSKMDNRDATADPSEDNDSSEGYVVGSIWINQTSGVWFFCRDNSVGEAIWTELETGGSGAGGGGLYLAPYSSASVAGAYEENKNGIEGLMVDSNSMGVGTSFIVPSDYDHTKDTLFLNIPALMTKTGTNSVNARFVFQGVNTDIQFTYVVSMNVFTSQALNRYEIMKVELPSSIVSNMLVYFSIESRAWALYNANILFPKNGMFISKEKR